MNRNVAFLANPNSLREQSGIATSYLFKAWSVVGFLLLHIPLALIAKRVPAISTLHAFATVIVGLWLAQSARRPERVAYVGAYIAGAEVLWRMSQAQIFWEYGKYAVVTIFLIALVRQGKFKGSFLPLLYFSLLIPSIVITATTMPFERAQRAVSFNLSGPFALAVCCLYFSRQIITKEQLRVLFLAMLGPFVGIAFVTLTGTVEAGAIRFGGSSLKITSGGFGPNQVSSMLGLGALIAVFLALDSKVSNTLRLLMLSVAVFLGMQSALTFSRNGVFAAVLCGGLAAILLLRDKRSRIKVILVAALIIVLASVFVPRLDAFTGGALYARFQNTSSTGRDRIVLADLQIWKDNILFGVGPGGSTDLHALTFRKTAAHTEYSRLLSEHGMLGMLALIFLAFIGIRNIARTGSSSGTALTTAMVAWCMLYMATNAMRLVAPSFVFGLTCVVVLSEVQPSLESVRARIRLLALKLARLKPITS